MDELEFWKQAAETQKNNNLKLIEENRELREARDYFRNNRSELYWEIQQDRDGWRKVAEGYREEMGSLAAKLQSIQQERDKGLEFPRQVDRLGDWIINAMHLEEVARNIENYHGDDAPDYIPSLEQIEMVLLAVERMAKSE